MWVLQLKIGSGVVFGPGVNNYVENPLARDNGPKLRSLVQLSVAIKNENHWPKETEEVEKP
jgi:hypothetical protein